ncbi:MULTISPECIES: hypothetical protein [Microbacterium]|uniref:hypothetical protein n=1 Tax=Microbacterium TaxID=33882 RepID=UPI002783DBF3|nr:MULTISPECIES: hypothetical protein [Microbacterium]MDQ1084751.1 hypothetical protein [Microbacterium sp. SORGH_AS_0344]MDQ1169970.1 hypothetical protein [Microbacterium proteolyticum]
MHHPSPPRRRAVAVLTLIAALLGGLGVAPAAQAAERGTGFGTWAPLSRTGWHGSMRVGDVHTYCIHPGLPVATDPTTDHGVSSHVNGLSPQQLISINYLVGTYGQTDDPVQAAGVGWAVKAIADRATTLHSWGYTGESLPEAIDFIMRRASPENSEAVQQRAVHYLAEAEAIAVPRVGGSLTLTARDDDPTRGTVTADVDPSATGTLHLDNAVFADTGRNDRADVHAGQAYDIIAPASASDGGRPYTVRATGSFSVRSAAIRFFSTPGQQESAGPADPTTFALSSEDATPRPVLFAPRIETTARIADGRFIDSVTVSAGDGVWPRHADGSFIAVVATADVYRTGAYPAESAEIPSNLTPVMRLDLRTDPEVGAGVYEIPSESLPGPGVYTAVWRVEREAQDAETIPHLPTGYRWQERFASPAQTEQLAPPAPRSEPTPTPTVAPTRAAAPPSPSSAPTLPEALAQTGISAASLGGAGGAAVAVIGLGVTAWAVARRRSTPRM